MNAFKHFALKVLTIFSLPSALNMSNDKDWFIAASMFFHVSESDKKRKVRSLGTYLS